MVAKPVPTRRGSRDLTPPTPISREEKRDGHTGLVRGGCGDLTPPTLSAPKTRVEVSKAWGGLAPAAVLERGLGVVVRLGHRLQVVRIEEQPPVALVRRPVVDHGGRGHPPPAMAVLAFAERLALQLSGAGDMTRPRRASAFLLRRAK